MGRLLLCALVFLLLPQVGVTEEGGSSLPTRPAEPLELPNIERNQSESEPREPSVPEINKSSERDSRASVCLMLEAAARSNGLPVDFFARVIWQESRFRADAVGPATRSGRKAQGIAQFMPGTALERNLLDPFDPVQALPKSAELLQDLRVQFGNLGLAAAAYNAGPRRVREWMNGTGSMPAETRDYVKAITGTAVEEWAIAGSVGDQNLHVQSACGALTTQSDTSNPFVKALERKIAVGSAQPWTVVLTAGFSRTKILAAYAKLERNHRSALSGYDAFITQSQLHNRGRVPFYQVRVGVPDRSAASSLCDRIREQHGACIILRNQQA